MVWWGEFFAQVMAHVARFIIIYCLMWVIAVGARAASQSDFRQEAA